MTDENFVYNYQWEDDENLANGNEDKDIADWAGIGWNESQESVYTKLAAVINTGSYDNAYDTTGGVWMFSQKIAGDNDMAGVLSLAKTNAMIDGATVDAKTISVTDGSNVTFAKQDTSLLNTSTKFFSVVGSTEPGAYDGIRSNGVTTLNAETINISDSGLTVKSGASAILNASTIATLNNVTVNGGRGELKNTGNMTISESSFTGNTVTTNGGAIYNSGTMTITDGLFDGNTAMGTYTPNNEGTEATYSNGAGGAIYNNSTLTVGGTFENNNAFHGGAIYNRGTLTVSNGSVFDNNYANVEGGAIASYGNLNIGNEVVFKNNKSFLKSGDLDVASGGSEMGAAIYSEGTATLTRTVEIGDGVKFTNNNSYGGTAYFFGANNVNIGDGVEFVGNKGVAAAGLRTSKAGNGDTIITVGDNAKFTENEVSNGRGAAIHMGVSGTNLTVGDNVIISDNIGNAIRNSSGTAVFGANGIYSGNNAFMVEGNAQSGLGGVLRNEGTATTTFNGGLFTDNTAAKNGGAIYNEGFVTIAGTTTFTGNTANGVANDIYNVGTLTFADNSATKMDGGINGVGDLVLGTGATLSLGTASIEQGSFELNGTVNGDLFSADKFASFDVGTFDGNGTINLTLKGVGEYKVFASDVFNTGSVNVADSSVFTYNWNNDKDTITVATKSVNEITAATNVRAEAATAVVSLANAKDETAREIGRVLGAALAEGNTEYVEHETKKLTPGEKPVAHSVASNVQNQVLSLTANRMAGGMAGRAGGDEINADFGVWAQGLYNKTRYIGNFDGHSAGIAFGADALIDKVYTIGLGYSFSKSDIDSNDDRDIDIDSHTVFVYGQYKPSKWFINATLSNTISKYTESAVVAGLPVETKYDVNAFGIQGMTGYDFASGATPMVGVRYLHVSTDGYDTLPGYVGDMNSSSVSAVGGLKYAFQIQNTGELELKPELRAMATYDVISDKNGATVYVPGGTSYHIAGDRMSRAGAELGMGVTAEWRGLELSLNYDVQLRKDYLSHTGMLKL